MAQTIHVITAIAVVLLVLTDVCDAVRGTGVYSGSIYKAGYYNPDAKFTSSNTLRRPPAGSFTCRRCTTTTTQAPLPTRPPKTTTTQLPTGPVGPTLPTRPPKTTTRTTTTTTTTPTTTTTTTTTPTTTTTTTTTTPAPTPAPPQPTGPPGPVNTPSPTTTTTRRPPATPSPTTTTTTTTTTEAPPKDMPPGSGRGGSAFYNGGPFSISGGRYLPVGSRLYSSYVNYVPSFRQTRAYSGYRSIYYYYYNLYNSEDITTTYKEQHYGSPTVGVCVNYELRDDGTVLGVFTCPLHSEEPEHFTACCGVEYAEFCCPFIDEDYKWWMKILIPAICLLICIITVTIYVCYLRKKNKVETDESRVKLMPHRKVRFGGGASLPINYSGGIGGPAVQPGFSPYAAVVVPGGSTPKPPPAVILPDPVNTAPSRRGRLTPIPRPLAASNALNS